MSLPDSIPLPKLFDVIGNKVPQLRGLADKAADLEKKVGTKAYVLLDGQKPQLTSGDLSFQVLNQPVTFSAELKGTLKIHGAADDVTLFDSDPQLDQLSPAPKLSAPEGTSFADFSLDGTLKGGASAKIPVKALTISARAAAAKRIRYRHLRPAKAGATRFDAFRDLLATSQLPHAVLDGEPDLTAGEVQVLETWLNLDFGLAASAGGEKLLSRLVDLFDDATAELKAHAEFAFSASLGWSLYDAMQLAVGSFDVGTPGWVRLRLQRRHRRRLTFGAKLDLQLSYDLGTSALEDLVERIFDQLPTPRLLGALREFDQLFAQGGAAAVKQKLSSEAQAAVADFLDDEGWIDKLTSDPAVQRLIELSGKIVSAYDDLDEKVKDFWDAFLASAKIGPGSKARRALQMVADLQEQSIEQVIEKLLGDGELKQALELLETLSGEDLEGLVIGDPDEVQAALDRASRLAREAIDFLDRVPEDFLSRLRGFAERTGIASTLAFLKKNLSSPEALRQAVDARVGGLVERVTGKLLAKIDDQDLKKLAAWIDKVLAAFDEVDEIESDVKNAVSRLKGELGFSFGVEISRVSESSAVVDLEIDPAKKDLRRAVDQALGSGDAGELIQALPQMQVAEGEKDDADEVPSYRLREAIFMSRRVRTAAFSSFISLFGNTSRRTSRIDAETVRVGQVKGKLRRCATYRGGLTRSILAEGQKATANGTDLGIWWRSKASGPDGALASPYTEIESQSLRLSFTRRDHKTLPAELQAIDAMLNDLGFLTPGGARAASLPAPPVHTRLSIDLRLDAASVAAFLRNEGNAGGFNRDYRNAAHRTFADPLIVKDFEGARLGAVLAALLEEPFFDANWTSDFIRFAKKGLNKPWRLEIDGRQVQDRWAIKRGSDASIRFLELLELVRDRGGAFKRLQKTAKALEELGVRPLPADLRQVARLFANAMGKALIKKWDLPASPLWLVLARLSRVASSSLLKARGVAVLRWKPTGAGDWNEPLVWRLENGLPAHDQDTIFPF